MRLVALAVANREQGIESCLKKMFNGEEYKYHFISDLSKYPDSYEYIKGLDSGGIDMLFVNACNIGDSALGGAFFDVLIYDEMSGTGTPMNAMYKNICPRTVIISNGDDGIVHEFTPGMKACVITYGLGQKCSLTPSCIDDSGEGIKFNLCVQRSMERLDGGKIEVGEIPFSIEGASINIYDALASAALKILISKDICG